jgi:DNA repair protein RecN (Recombination protein N)
VGELLQTLGSDRQVLCVTHLPQVAACADAHFRVTKTGTGDGAAGEVRSELTQLSAEERVEELARMLGGAAITAKTRAHAREMRDSAARSPEPSRRASRRKPG